MDTNECAVMLANGGYVNLGMESICVLIMIK